MIGAKKIFTENAGRKPLVMTYIGDDNPTRGDSRGYEGLGPVIAEMLKGRYVYVDAAMLRKNFPNLPDTKERLHAYLVKNGDPDIVLGTKSDDVKLIAKNRPKIQISSYNESLSTHRLGSSRLVSHHLTPELLQNAGEEFIGKYPDIKGPLVAVMLANNSYGYDDLAKKLAEVSSHYPEITFFLCSSRRAREADQALEKNLLEELTRPTADNKRTNKVEILSFNFYSMKDDYNPYAGLLAMADHIVIAGSSDSLLSEALFTGKNVYLYNTGGSRKLADQGYISDFMNLRSENTFPTKSLPPLNVTRDLAKSIVKDYREACKIQEEKAAAQALLRAQELAKKFNFWTTVKKYSNEIGAFLLSTIEPLAQDEDLEKKIALSAPVMQYTPHG